MKAVGMLLGAVLIFAPFTLANAYIGSSTSVQTSTSRGKKHGDFILLTIGKKDSLLMSNNRFYRPTNHKGAKKVRKWNEGDQIRILKTKDDDRYTLSNLNKAQTVKAKIFNWK